MLKTRPVAVFTLYNFVGGGKNLLSLLSMTVFTIFIPLIFYLNGPPLLFVPFSVPAIHVPAFVDSEILGHDEGPGDQDNSRQRQNHVQGS
jgi:hypothetical protein